MRDKLLDQHTELGWLFACAEKVMLQESTSYRENKRSWANETGTDADAKQWAQFVGIAESGAKVKKQCLAPLTKASAFWGNDKVRHYGWASMGWGYCKVLGTAVARSPDWNKALVKLNQLLLSRIAAGHCLKACANSIELIDLEQLKAWPDQTDFEKGRHGRILKYQMVTDTDLPDGYGFDRYGLVVLVEFACQLQPATHANTQSTVDKPQPLKQAAEDTRASVSITCDPITAKIDGLLSSPTSTFPNTHTISNSASSSLLSSARSTPATSPDPEFCGSSRASEEDGSMAHLPPPAKTATTSNSNVASASLRTSNRLRSCPTQSYTLSNLQTKKTNTSTRTRPVRSRKAAGLLEPKSSTGCSCPDKVAPKFLSAIDRKPQANTVEEIEIATRYGAEQESLCLEHLRKYARWATTSMLCYKKSNDSIALQTPKRLAHDLWSSFPSTATKRRRLSLPEASSNINRVSGEVVPQDNGGIVFFPVPEPSSDVRRPTYDAKEDSLFRQQVLVQLSQKTRQKRAPKTWGQLNNQTMLSLLSRASQPRTLRDESEEEVYFMTGEEARSLLESGATLHGPIITEGQQQFQWEQRKGRPVEQLFRRMGNPNKTVSVQMSSLSLQQPSCAAMRLGDIYDTFAENKASDDPLNVLDLRNPLPRSILPHFLTGEDCQLLSRVRDTILEGATAERCTAQVAEWNKWRDDEDWVLLAQGGAHTLTHQDSCGKATWLTVQEGLLGFGWISHPSREEIASWSADPNGFTSGQLRYVVLRPGQTVYFEAGMIHFVFRLEQHQTLLVGGHVLRWSRIESWMEVVLAQLRFPNTTNEDLQPSVRAYVEAVAQLVSEQLSLGRSDELGGEEAVARFFDLKTVSRCGARW
jgi:hypothetical protein